MVLKTRTGWDVLLIRDMNDAWTFPKGLVEANESYETTAAREIQEEVGIDKLTLLSPLSPIRYFYRRNGTIQKTVHYFLFQVKRKKRLKVQREEGIREAAFVPLHKALTQVGYAKTNVPLLKKTQRFLSDL